MYEHFNPIPELAEYIDCFWSLKASGIPGIVPKSTLPGDGRGLMLLSFSGTTRLTSAGGIVHDLGAGADILGAHEESYVLEHTGDTCLVAVQFLPGGLSAFVPFPVHEITSGTIAFNLLWGSAGDSLLGQIAEAGATAGKLRLFQNFLLERLAETRYHPRIAYAVDRIGRAMQGIAISRLANEVNLSQKQLERVFESAVGMMPKRYSRLARFQNIVDYLHRKDRIEDWTNLAAHFGFYDHSHMVKDFQTFAGVAPSQFSKATAGIIEVVYGDIRKSQEV